MELDDAYFGAKSHGPGKRGRGTDQDPVVVGISLTAQGHPRYVFVEAVSDLGETTVKEGLRRRVENLGVWKSDGAAVYASAAQEHEADHQVTVSTDPAAHEVFHWIDVVISNAKTFIDGTYHGRGRALADQPALEIPHRKVQQPSDAVILDALRRYGSSGRRTGRTPGFNGDMCPHIHVEFSTRFRSRSTVGTCGIPRDRGQK